MANGLGSFVSHQRCFKRKIVQSAVNSSNRTTPDRVPGVRRRNRIGSRRLTRSARKSHGPTVLRGNWYRSLRYAVFGTVPYTESRVVPRCAFDSLLFCCYCYDFVVLFGLLHMSSRTVLFILRLHWKRGSNVTFMNEPPGPP